MTEYELHSLIADLFRDIGGMQEFWLSGTFAVIVARFVAGNYLSRRVLWVMTFLYLMATGISGGRMLMVIRRYADYQLELAALGFQEFFQPQVLLSLIASFNVTLFVGGTAATVYFLLQSKAPTYAGGPEPEASAG